MLDAVVPRTDTGRGMKREADHTSRDQSITHESAPVFQCREQRLQLTMEREGGTGQTTASATGCTAISATIASGEVPEAHAPVPAASTRQGW